MSGIGQSRKMTPSEFLALPDEVVELADRICQEQVTENQINFIVTTKNLDMEEIKNAVDFIERTKTKATFLLCLGFVLCVYLGVNIILFACGVN